MPIVEALLLAGSSPVSGGKLSNRLPEDCNVLEVPDKLSEIFTNRSANLTKVAGKWAFRTATDRFFLLKEAAVEQKELFKAALETLAIIACHQPVTRVKTEGTIHVSIRVPGHFGFDALDGNGLVAGLTASDSKGEIDFETTGNEGLSYNAQTTGMHPYFGFESSDGSRLQVIAGYGLGEIGLDQDGYGTESLDSSYASFGGSGRRTLYSSDSLLYGGRQRTET